MKITDRVHLIPSVSANCYVIIDEGGLTLIDAGLPRSASRILEFVASLGRSPRDVERIVLTHADWDHVGSLRALHRATGARTFASRIEAEAIAAGRSSRPSGVPPTMSLRRRLMRLLWKPRPFKIDQILSIDEILAILDGLRVIDSAGHCPGHISLFAPSVGILFCGDSMVTDEHGIHGSRPVFTWDAAMAQQAVNRQAELGARILCSGHGPVIMDARGRFPVAAVSSSASRENQSSGTRRTS